jgi:hypothetical protein
MDKHFGSQLKLNNMFNWKTTNTAPNDHMDVM